MTPEEYCQELTARSGSSFYYSFLFLPEERRRAITAFYAFCREVDDVVDECRDTQVARAKLLWWRNEVEAMYQGRPQHPVTQALQPCLTRYGLKQEHFRLIIEGMAMDLEPVPYADFDALHHYCYRVAGVVGLVSAAIFGYDDPGTEAYAEQLGIAFQLTNILRDIREDLARGRVYLPQDELARFGVDTDMLRENEQNEAVLALLKYQAERADAYYDKALALLPIGDRRRQRSGLIMAAIYRAVLHKIQREGYPVLRRRVRLSLWKKLWLAWSTARRIGAD